MKKVLHIAVREFLATVMTKGFLIGMLAPPVILGIILLVFPRLINRKPPSIQGDIAVIDTTGKVLPGLRAYLVPDAIAKSWDDEAKRDIEATPKQVREVAGSMPGGDKAVQAALKAARGAVPRFTVVELPADASVEREKEPLKEKDKGRDAIGRVALVVIHPDAVVRAEGKAQYGAYDLFIRGKLDDRIDDEIRAGVRKAIIDARVAQAGLDQSQIDAITYFPRVRSTTVTRTGESKAGEVLNVFVPMGMALLLMMSVITSGQSLMSTTIEEKSSRVVEVLLSAVSPMQLMTGKILGQMCVGLTVLSLYASAGLFTLFSFALLGFLDMSLLFYLVIFFLITYFVMASLMGAIGAAVNELREAQALLTPVMLVLMLPWILWMPISREPNSLFSTIISLTPPVNSFAMLLRMSSTSPPPLWQVWLSIAIGAASVYAALWFAAKVFRVGLLMYGKPPNFSTLIRWVRMA